MIEIDDDNAVGCTGQVMQICCKWHLRLRCGTAQVQGAVLQPVLQ